MPAKKGNKSAPRKFPVHTSAPPGNLNLKQNESW